MFLLTRTHNNRVSRPWGRKLLIFQVKERIIETPLQLYPIHFSVNIIQFYSMRVYPYSLLPPGCPLCKNYIETKLSILFFCCIWTDPSRVVIRIFLGLLDHSRASTATLLASWQPTAVTKSCWELLNNLLRKNKLVSYIQFVKFGEWPGGKAVQHITCNSTLLYLLN